MSDTQTPPAPTARRKMKFRNKCMLIVFSLLAMAFLRTGFIFVIIALLPSIVVYYLDQSPQRYTFRTIFTCNLSGLLPFIGRMIQHGPTSSILSDIMGAASTWVIIYGAAMVGGILISVAPLIAQSLIGSIHQNQVNRLQRVQKKIENEWGKEVTQFAMHHETEN